MLTLLCLVTTHIWSKSDHLCLRTAMLMLHKTTEKHMPNADSNGTWHSVKLRWDLFCTTWSHCQTLRKYKQPVVSHIRQVQWWELIWLKPQGKESSVFYVMKTMGLLCAVSDLRQPASFLFGKLCGRLLNLWVMTCCLPKNIPYLLVQTI